MNDDRVLFREDAVIRDGWDNERLQKAFALLDQAIREKTIPGAVAAVGRGDRTAATYAGGYAVDTPGEQVLMQVNTRFDVASLTKVCSVLPLMLLLLDDGEIRLNDPVARFLPSFGEGDRGRITLKHLLTHSSGLPPHRPFYKQRDGQHADREAIWGAVLSEPLIHEPGAVVDYSDIGFMTLGKVIEAIARQTLDQLCNERIFKPLAMVNAKYCPLHGEGVAPFAATEYDERHGYYLIGEVHDENARAVDGVSGHAGLFTDVSDLVKYVKMWVRGGIAEDGTTFLSSSAIRLALVNHVDALSAARGLGWCLRTDGYDHMGDYWPMSGFGHTGFTGTSLSLDLPSGIWIVLLTNRVHFGRQVNIARLRATVHNVVMAASS